MNRRDESKQDISGATAHEEAGLARATLAAVVESTADAVYSYDFDGTLRSWNRAAEQLFGYRAPEVIGRNVALVVPDERKGEIAGEIIPAIRRGERIADRETVRLRRDGTTFDALLTASPVVDETAEPVAVAVLVRDISERRAAQRTLEERNRQLELLARCAKLLVMETQPTEELLAAVFGEVAQAIGAEMYFHYQPHDAASMRLCNWGGLTDDERTLFETMRYGELLCGRVAARRQRLIVEDIAHTDVEGSEAVRAAGYGAYAGFPLVTGGRLLGTIAFITRTKTHFADGEIQVLQSVCDQMAAVLERRQAAARLAEREAQLALFVEHSPAAIAMFDSDMRYLAVSRRFLVAYELPAHDVVGRSHYELFPDIPERWRDVHRRVLAGETLRDDADPYPRAGGRIDWVRWTMTPWRGAGGTIGGALLFSEVITDEIEAQRAIAESEERLRFVTDRAGVGYWHYAFEPDRLDWSEGCKRMFGLRPEQSIDYARFLAAVHREDRERVDAAARTCLASDGAQDYDIEFRARRPSGAERWIRAKGNATYEGGRASRMAGIALDVTERKRATEALRESETRFQTLANGSPALLWVNGRDDCEFVNDAYRAFLGISADVAATGYDCSRFVHAGDRERYLEAYSAAFESAAPFTAEHRFRRFDGEWRWMRTEATPRLDSRGGCAGYVGVSVDITERKRTEEALHTAGASFRQLVEQSPFGIYAVDADFRLAMVSAGAQNVFRSVRPLLGRDFDEVLRVLWPEPFVSEALGHFRRTLATGEPYHSPSTVEQRADIGATEAYDWKIERMVLPDGRPGVVCHFYDLTEHQRYEDSLRVARDRLETALAASPTVLFNQDRDLRYTWIQNPGLVFADAQVLGKRDRDLIDCAEDAARVEAIKCSVIAGGAARREEIRVTCGDARRYFDLVVQPDRDAGGDIIGVSGAALDITGRKEIEAQLRQADRQKDEFLAMLAHELRNPLAPIRNAAAILARTLPDDPAIQRPLAMIDRQSTQLTRLVEDLLDVSRIVSGRIELERERIEVGAILEQAAESVGPLIAEKRHHLRIDRPQEKLYVDGDRARLVQAVGNLVHNAAKYTDPAGAITLTVRASETELRIEVRDTGTGIPPELLPRIYDLFVQGERTLDRAQGGLGIGLSVVRRIVEMHGGTVRASSDGAGRGSAFTVCMPRSPPPRSATASKEMPRPVTRRRILVVDDNVDAADSLAVLLGCDGHEVRTAYDGAAALAAIEAHSPDLVLLDIGMPQMDGYQVAQAVRGARGDGDARPYLVAVTGYGQATDRARARAAGFFAHLVKPVDRDELSRVLDSLDESAASR